MSELLASSFGLIVLLVCAVASARALPVDERRWVWASAAAHGLSAVAKVWLVFYYYGDGDMDSYIRYSHEIADLVRSDPGRWLWPYVEMALHRDVRVPYLPPGDSGPTRTMYAIAGIHQALFGENILGSSLLVAAFSLASKVAVYRVFRDHLPARYRTRLAIGVLLIPSAVFWSSALSKEGVLWMSCGWVLYGFHVAVFKRRTVFGTLLAVVAAGATALVKPYVLVPMAIGCAVWLYVRSERRRPRSPASPLIALTMAMVVFGVASLLVVGLGELFPRYRIQNFAEQAEGLQSHTGSPTDGSSYSLDVDPGLGGQLAAAPVAALTAIYRPLIFEANNPLMFVNALETTLFILLTLYVLRERGIGVIRVVMSSPALIFCTVYVLLFSVAVGLTSTNLGTLSRYRMPMMPYLGVLFAVLVPMPRPRPPVGRATRRRRGGTVVPLHAG